MKKVSRRFHITGIHGNTCEFKTFDVIQKLVISIFFLFLSTMLVWGQNQRVNSLKILVDDSKKDNNQVDVLNKLGALLQQTNPSESESYTKKALNISMDISYTIGQAVAYTNLGDLSASYRDDYLQAAKYYEKAYDIYRELYRNNQIDKWLVYKFLTGNAIPTYNKLSEKPKRRRYRKARKYYQKLHVEFTDYLTFLATHAKDKILNKEFELKDKDYELKAKEKEILTKQAKLKEVDKRLRKAGIELRLRQLAQKLLELAKDSLSDSLFIAETIRLKLVDSLMMKELEIRDNQLKIKDGKLKLLRQRQKLGKLELEKAHQQTLISSFTVGVILLVALAFVLYRSYRLQKRSNTLLTKQRNELRERNGEIKTKNEQIQAKSKKITESINYARRIQKAILPDHMAIKNLLPNSFIYYQPYQIVSGDFYWFGVVDKKIVYAAVDCTGHGIPGAFMSMIGSALLNEIVKQKQITESHIILNHLHIGIRDSLRQKDTHNQDGMDMAIVVVDTEKYTMDFSGAKNPLVYIQNGELNFIKGDRYPIGDVINRSERDFTKHTIQLDESTVCYMFSDGYQDQFGGPQKRKFMGKRLRNMLLEYHHLDFEKQKEIYERTLLDWIAETGQIDDVLLIGFKFDQEVVANVELAVNVRESV